MSGSQFKIHNYFSRISKHFFKLYFMQLFSADATIFLKNSNIFFAPENMKEAPSKVGHNRPRVFVQYWPGCPNGPKAEISYHQKPLMQDWVFRLGCLTVSIKHPSLDIFREKVSIKRLVHTIFFQIIEQVL